MRLHRWLHLDPAAWRPLPFSPPPCLCLLQPSTAIRPLPPRFFFSPSPCRAASALSSASRFVLLFIIVASLLPTAGAAAGTAAVVVAIVLPIVAIILIGGFGGYYYYKRRQKRIPMATVQPTESATGAATPVGGQLLVQPPDLPD